MPITFKINSSADGNLSTRTKGPKPQRAWQTIAGAKDPRVDPYMVWFDFSYDTLNGKDLRDEDQIDVLVELPAVKTGAALDRLVANYQFTPRMPPLPHAEPCFVSGYLPIAQMLPLARAITGQADALSVLRIELASARFVGTGEKRLLFELVRRRMSGLPKALWDKHQDVFAWLSQQVPKTPPGALLAQALGWSPGPRRDVLNGWKAAKSVPRSDPLVVVIDDGCNHASHALSGRVRSIWHQGGPLRATVHGAVAGVAGPSAGNPLPDNDPGRELYGSVDQLRPRDSAGDQGPNVPQTGAAAARDERHAYGLPDDDDDDDDDDGGDSPASGSDLATVGKTANTNGRRRRPSRLPPSWSHGSAVLSMLARRVGPSPPGTSPDGLDGLLAPLDIDFVQLPDVAVLDTSGGSLSGYALDAIHRAVRLADNERRPSVIVNLSFGTHSGPHDGSSMFERALKELLQRFNGTPGTLANGTTVPLPQLHVVLPAGNTHTERSHASARLPAGGSQTLHWLIPPDNETDSFIEVWLDGATQGIEQTLVDITLAPPGGATATPDCHTSTVAPGGVTTWTQNTPDGPVLSAAVIYPKTTSKSPDSRMALIAVAPTQQRAGHGLGETYRSGTDGPLRVDRLGRPRDALQRVRMQAPPGCWTVTLHNRGTQSVVFHAWVQRHDAAPGRRRASKGYQGRQSSFIEAPGSAVDPRFTLSGIATASHPNQLWVVGAMDERGGIPLYSAAGPDRLHGVRLTGPDTATVVDRGRNLPGRHVGGFLSGSRLRLGGTSIAAAAFTRMLYHTLVNNGPMGWCTPGRPAPPPVKTAETPELADDWMRGGCVRLIHANDLAVDSPSCRTWPQVDNAPAGSCKP